MKFKVYGRYKYGRSFRYVLGIYEAETHKEAREKANAEHLEMAERVREKTGRFNPMIATNVVILGHHPEALRP